MTAFEDAFTKAGLSPAENELAKACAKYFNSPRATIERFDHVVEQARTQMAGVGQSRLDSQYVDANPRQPVPDAGRHTVASPKEDAGIRDHIPGSGHHARETQGLDAADQETKPAGMGQGRADTQASRARPGRVPESRIIPRNQAPSAERMRAVREAGHSSVATIYDRFRTLDGRRIGDIRVSEYRHLAASNIRHASLYLRLADIAFQRGKLGPGVTTRELLKARELEQVIIESGVIDVESRTKDGILIEPNGKLHLVNNGAFQ